MFMLIVAYADFSQRLMQFPVPEQNFMSTDLIFFPPHLIRHAGC